MAIAVWLNHDPVLKAGGCCIKPSIKKPVAHCKAQLCVIWCVIWLTSRSNDKCYSRGDISKGHAALKLFSLGKTQWLPLWYLEMKLQRRRLSDPALSWADRCEGPSMG